jgi:3-oxoacyl-[acyl-carrier protein] reductase
MSDFEKRLCVVTGAGRGIGRAIAQALHNEGAIVVGVDRDDSLGPAFEGELPGAAFYPADVSNREQVAQALEAVVARFGGIDHLVCNAGISRDALVLRLTERDWNAQLAVNLTGTFYVVQASLRSLIRREGSSIVAISSVIGETGNAGQAAYAASKAGISAFCRSVAKEVATRGVRVNVVAPGYVATEMTEALPEDVRAAYLARIPLGRAAEPSEIAAVTLFLLSPRASYITGQIVGVNGGMFP